MFGAEYAIRRGMEPGCDKCLEAPTNGQCCPKPVLYYMDPRWSGAGVVQLANWPTKRCPYYCEAHGVAAEKPLSCPWCERGTPPRKIPRKPSPAPGTYQPMGETERCLARYRDEDPDAAPGDGVYGDDCTPPMTGGTPATTEERDMAAKKAKKSPTPSPKTRSGKKKGRSEPPEEKEGPDRTGQVQRELSEEDITKRGRELAKQERKLQKKVKEKTRANKIFNEEIHTLEEVIAELSEQVDTGFEWVAAQTSIPGTQAAE